MTNKKDFITFETAWCPGCGDFGILEALRETCSELGLDPHKLLVVGGIGQAAKTTQYINGNSFAGLHGRALPPAAAAKIVNHELKVVINTGDGDSYGEGGNHFIHNIKRNADITHFVHNNQIYGLTKGQASPTTAEGQITTLQFDGVKSMPLDPLALSLTLGAGFIARGFAGDIPHLVDLMKQAITFKGYAHLDILQPCVVWNKVNTFKWYKDRVYKLSEDYDNTDYDNAYKKSKEFGDKIPIGVLYKVEKPTYGDSFKFIKDGEALVNRKLNPLDAKILMNDFI